MMDKNRRITINDIDNRKKKKQNSMTSNTFLIKLTDIGFFQNEYKKKVV